MKLCYVRWRWGTAGVLLGTEKYCWRYCWGTAGVLLGYCWGTAGVLLGTPGCAPRRPRCVSIARNAATR
eukprot:7248616-Pyramimonas_sp.AAC.1